MNNVDSLPMDKWIEVDLDKLEHNYRQIREQIPEEVAIMGVVKADAYGLGSFEVANLLEQLNIDYLAVTYVQEGLDLRERGIALPILVFAPARSDNIMEAIKHNLTLTVDSAITANLIRSSAERLNRQVKVHIKIDTGLSRFGLEPLEALEVINQLAADERMNIEGVYTHLARAGASNPRWTISQYQLFTEVLTELDKQRIKIKYRHCCNSQGTLRFPEMHQNMVRIGTLLGGQYPAGNIPRNWKLKDPYAFKSTVLSLKPIPKGRYIGYGGTYRNRKPALLAVIPVGFQDGLGVAALSHPGGFIDYIKWCARLFLVYINKPRAEFTVRIRGNSFPIRGKVFMQMCVVEIPAESRIKVGDEVNLPVRRTAASANITRIYLKEGEPGRQESVKKTSTYVTEY